MLLKNHSRHSEAATQRVPSERRIQNLVFPAAFWMLTQAAQSAMAPGALTQHDDFPDFSDFSYL